MQENKIYRGYLLKTGVLNETGWGTGVFTLEDDVKRQLSIKGIIGSMNKKTLYEISGVFEEHPRYGKSLKVETFRKAPIHSNKEQINFLAGASFPGIGKKTAQIIVEYLQDDAIKKLSENIELLKTIPNLDKTYVPIIQAGIEENIKSDGQERLRYIFFENNLKTTILDWMENNFDNQNDTIKAIFEERFLPYAYNREIASFEELDKVAVCFGLSLTSPERIGYWAWKIASDFLFSTGDTYTNKNSLSRKLMQKLKIDDVDLIMDGFMLAKNEKILVFKENKIYTKESYGEEQIISTHLIKFNKINQKINDKRLDHEISLIEKEISSENKIKAFSFDEVQKQALKNFATNRLLILTGGPGTGKTTLIKAMVKLYERLEKNSNFAIATPTGRAAGRIRETFKDSNAITIHKLLQAKQTNTFKVNAENPLKEHLVIIDECSMIDNTLFAKFLESCEYVKKIVLVGDANQLPSVNYGNVFADLIDANILNIVALKLVHRQAKDSEIIDLAYKTLAKEVELADLINKKHLISHLDLPFQEVLDKITQLFKKAWDELQNKQNYLQIICPMYGGNLGIDEINAEIQYKFNANINDKKKVYQRGDYRFVVDDKIMFLRNEQDYDLSNGDVGKIIKFNYNATNRLKEVVCEFNEKEVKIRPSDFNDVKLAYATSVHKTQGSEYKNVILVLDENRYNNIFLTNSLIYTAITRTKEKLHIFSQTNTLFNTIAKDSIRRKTTLIENLNQNKEHHE